MFLVLYIFMLVCWYFCIKNNNEQNSCQMVHKSLIFGRWWKYSVMLFPPKGLLFPFQSWFAFNIAWTPRVWYRSLLVVDSLVVRGEIFWKNFKKIRAAKVMRGLNYKSTFKDGYWICGIFWKYPNLIYLRMYELYRNKLKNHKIYMKGTI